MGGIQLTADMVVGRQEVGPVVVALGEHTPEEAAKLALPNAWNVNMRRLCVSWLQEFS